MVVKEFINFAIFQVNRPVCFEELKKFLFKKT